MRYGWAADDSIRKEVERRLRDRRDVEEALRIMIVEKERLEWQKLMEVVKMRNVLR